MSARASAHEAAIAADQSWRRCAILRSHGNGFGVVVLRAGRSQDGSLVGVATASSLARAEEMSRQMEEEEEARL